MGRRRGARTPIYRPKALSRQRRHTKQRLTGTARPPSPPRLHRSRGSDAAVKDIIDHWTANFKLRPSERRLLLLAALNATTNQTILAATLSIEVATVKKMSHAICWLSGCSRLHQAVMLILKEALWSLT